MRRIEANSTGFWEITDCSSLAFLMFCFLGMGNLWPELRTPSIGSPHFYISSGRLHTSIDWYPGMIWVQSIKAKTLLSVPRVFPYPSYSSAEFQAISPKEISCPFSKDRGFVLPCGIVVSESEGTVQTLESHHLNGRSNLVSPCKAFLL